MNEIDDLRREVAELRASVVALQSRRPSINYMMGRNPLVSKYAALGSQAFNSIRAGKTFVGQLGRFFPVVVERQGGITLNGSPDSAENQPVLRFHDTDHGSADKVMYLQDSGLSVYISPDSAGASFLFGIFDRNEFPGGRGFLLVPRFGSNEPYITFQGSVNGGLIFADGTFVNKTKAGIPTDSDVAQATSGMCVLDTTNSRIYFRVGTTWKYAVLT